MRQKRFPDRPAHPERMCWGCDRYCAADNLLCGNGSERTQHPMELFGEDWRTWGLDAEVGAAPPQPHPSDPSDPSDPAQLTPGTDPDQPG